MQKLNRTLNHENKSVKPDPSNFFRFFVGKSNNHQCVRQIIKRRSWWHRVNKLEDDELEQEPHFVWTAWRKQEITQKMISKRMIYNRLDANYHLSNKKALFVNLYNYY
jgi:hypothetical protein